MARYGVLVAAVVAIAVAGYIGYVLYPRFDLAAVEGAGLLGLAAAAGIASFFSPCSFPLLVGLLGRPAATPAGGRPTRPLLFGGALAAGAAAFMLLAGLVIAAGGEAVFAGVTFTSTDGIAIRGIFGGVEDRLRADPAGSAAVLLPRRGTAVRPDQPPPGQAAP